MEYINSDEFLTMVWMIGMGTSTIVAIVCVIFTDMSIINAISILMAGVFTHYIICLAVIFVMGGVMIGTLYGAFWLLRSIRKIIPFKPIRLS